MIILLVAVFLALAVASIVIEFRFRQARLRMFSYAVLMLTAIAVVIYSYRQIESTADRLELRGQYFPINSAIRLSNDPAIADYFAPGMTNQAQEFGASEKPLIEISSFDQEGMSQVVAKGLAQPLSYNGMVLNIRLLAQQGQIKVGNLEIASKRDTSLIVSLTMAGLFAVLLIASFKLKISTPILRVSFYLLLLALPITAAVIAFQQLGFGQFVINGKSYVCKWPRTGAMLPMSEMLCRAGLSHDEQFEAIYANNNSAGNETSATVVAKENPLANLWVMRQGLISIGLVNGSNEAIQVDGETLRPEVKFTIRNGDRIRYGAGRQPFEIQVKVEPGDNRVYLLPERATNYPLYLSTESSEAQVFISSAPTLASPAYEFALGERNRDLIKGVLQYSLKPDQIIKPDLPDEIQKEKKQLVALYKEGFIVNSGLELRSYKFGETATIGTNSGGILISLTRKEVQTLRPIINIVAIWFVTMVFFMAYGGISKQNYLFVFMPLVQMFLALRLILSFRGYVLPPSIATSYEKALFGAIFIPFAIFLWLYSKQISEAIDSSKYLPYQRGLFGAATRDRIRQILIMPPSLYMLASFGLMWAVGALSSGYAPIGMTIGFFIASIVVASLLASKTQWTADEQPIEAWVAEGFSPQGSTGRGLIQRLKEFFNRWRLPALDAWLLLLAPIILAGALKAITGRTEEIPYLAIRGEIFYQPLLFVGGCRFYMWFFSEFLGGFGKLLRWYHYFWLSVPPGAYVAQAAVVGDWGFCVYGVPMLLLALIISWRSTYFVAFASIVVVSLIVIFVTSPLFTEQVTSLLPDDSTVEYRYLAYQDPGYLQEVAIEASDKYKPEASLCHSGSSAARRIFQIHEHFWTMLHFASRGSSGVGYGAAPIEKVSFPNGIAQSDNTYSIYILSEFGSRGGVVVMALYLFMAILVIFILTQHLADKPAPTLLSGGAILVVVISALYHAAGNVRGVPFTGKNLPLLSLNSYSDILHIGLLLALAISLVCAGGKDLPSTNAGLPAAFRGKGATLNKWLLATCALLLACFGFVAVFTVKAADDEVFRRDYDLSRFIETTKDYISRGIITLNKQTLEIELDNNKARGLAEGQYLRSLRDQFNLATAEEKEIGKYFFMARHLLLYEDMYGAEKPMDKYRDIVLTVDENYFKRMSPFAAKVFWKGGLRSSDSSLGDQGYLSGEGVTLFLQHVIDSPTPIPGLESKQDVRLPAPDERTAIGEQYISRLFRVLNDQGEGLFDLYSMETDAVLEPIAASTFINGQPVRHKTRLEPGDIVAIARTQPRTGGRDLVFIYQRSPSGLLAHHRWINGSEQFTYPQGEAFALARPILEAINTSIGRLSQEGETIDAEATATQPLALSINADLNRKIYGELVKEGNAVWNEINARKRLPPRLAVTAMNPDTGEVLALASWPSHNPNPAPPEQEKLDPRSYTNLIRRRDPESIRLARNHNLTRHVLGSATKPFIASAVASAYPEILNLSVDDIQSQYDNVLGIPTKPAWKCHSQGRPGLIGWDQFLIKSNNLFAVTVGFLGLASGDSNGNLQFVNQTNPQRIWLNGHVSAREPDFGGRLSNKSGESINLENTQLASKMELLFEVQKSGPDIEPVSQVWRGAQQLRLLPERAAPLRSISPEMTNLALNRIDKARDFVSICLGGKTNLWSNVKSAEAFSRLVTGRRILASFVKADQEQMFDPMDGSFLTVQQPLLRALEGVTQAGGTASNLAGMISRINSGLRDGAGLRFTVFSKTGTLEVDSQIDDSNFIMAAGLWDPINRRLAHAVVLSIYIEKGGTGRAARFAGRLMHLLNQHFRWAPTVSLKAGEQ